MLYAVYFNTWKVMILLNMTVSLAQLYYMTLSSKQGLEKPQKKNPQMHFYTHTRISANSSNARLAIPHSNNAMFQSFWELTGHRYTDDKTAFVSVSVFRCRFRAHICITGLQRQQMHNFVHKPTRLLTWSAFKSVIKRLNMVSNKNPYGLMYEGRLFWYG